MVLKTKKTIQWPSRDNMTDASLKVFAEDLGILLSKTFRDIYDDLSNLGTGEDGREIELQKGTTHIQWRYSGETDWTDLVALEDITGADGENGTNGVDGDDGSDGKTILSGTAAPTTEGVDGDFYIRTTTNYIYGPKAGGVWPAGVSLVGPAPALGTWASATLGASTQAATDGFLVGFVVYSTAAGTSTIKTDAANPPTVIRSQMRSANANYRMPMFTPVKKNDYYLIEIAANHTGTFFWIPLA